MAKLYTLVRQIDSIPLIKFVLYRSLKLLTTQKDAEYVWLWDKLTASENV